MNARIGSRTKQTQVTDIGVAGWTLGLYLLFSVEL